MRCCVKRPTAIIGPMGVEHMACNSENLRRGHFPNTVIKNKYIGRITERTGEWGYSAWLCYSVKDKCIGVRCHCHRDTSHLPVFIHLQKILTYLINYLFFEIY